MTVELRGIRVAYGDSVPLVDLNESFERRFTVVTGPSGSGKSSLLRVISGTQAPTAGQVAIDGKSVRQPSWASAGDERVVLIHQDYRLVDFLSIEENLYLAAEVRGVAADRQRPSALLEQVHMDDTFLRRFPGSLSGGERQRVAIARALMCEARVLLADEPTGALDKTNTENVAEVLRAVGNDTDVQIIVATHDPIVAGIADEEWRLLDGSLVPA